MPLALLLSPDDQAVSAITAVLEEMSVKCERPLDGVSAARQLNSNNFDLVLVDCENLPAAKLIFDVCRRGKDGNNPVPIAIVDGRAGLPTAFRLGAELILTKPVAKDQARSTIRTAVSRIRKEEPSHSANAADAMAASPEHVEAPRTDANQAEGLLTNYEVSQTVPTLSVPEPQAMAASAASAAPSISAPAKPASSFVAPAMPTRSSAALPEFEPAAPKENAPKKEESKPPAITKFSDDPVLADLERAEQGEMPPAPVPVPQKPIFSAYPEKESKSRRPLVFLLLIVMAGGSFYAAWMYQPGFKALVQPQIDKVLSLIGMARPAASPTAAPVNPQPSSPPPSGGVGLPSSSITPTPVPTPATATPTAQIATVDSPTPEPAKSAAAKVEKPATIPTSASLQNVSETRNIAAAISATELPGEKTAIILSSKGAEKRLIHSVRATYPAAARTTGGDGTVVLKAVVDENGIVSDARAVEGNPVLATAAMKAVKQWRYRPYLRDGKALPFQTVVLVDFQRP